MLLWLAAGLLAGQSDEAEGTEPKGAYFIQRRDDDGKRRKTGEEDARELRSIIAKAFRDDETPEAEEIVEIVTPALRGPVETALPRIDWDALAGSIGELRAAVEAYQAALDQEEEDDMFALLLAA